VQYGNSERNTATTSRNKAKQKLAEMIVGLDNGIIDMRKVKKGQPI